MIKFKLLEALYLRRVAVLICLIYESKKMSYIIKTLTKLHKSEVHNERVGSQFSNYFISKFLSHFLSFYLCILVHFVKHVEVRKAPSNFTSTNCNLYYDLSTLVVLT